MECGIIYMLVVVMCMSGIVCCFFKSNQGSNLAVERTCIYSVYKPRVSLLQCLGNLGHMRVRWLCKISKPEHNYNGYGINDIA